jgi:NCS1 family nucleobase:cation symporter-1
LEKIAGGNLVKCYNLANGVLFCFLAGAMITVSATAVGIPFDMAMPEISDVYPNSALFVAIVLAVGLLIATVAALGYETVSKFANVAAPWMVLVFLACGVMALKQLEVANWAGLEAIWTESILFAQEGEGASRMGFWSVAFFAWFCNAAMHVGMADLSVFRFAKKSSSGWASAAGMYVGHFMAWIAAALMLAAQIKLTQDSNPVPGPMANQVVGLAGIICVIIAGWTTANPTIYRAGLAFQAIMPRVSRFKVTFAAGLLATLAGVFPAFAWKLLGFVGLYGTILAPMGGILFFDWYFKQKQNVEHFHNSQPQSPFNWSVLLAWLIPVGIAVYCIQFIGISAWYCPLPCWIACGLLYLLLSRRTSSTATA